MARPSPARPQVAIKPAHQGHGIGAALHDAFLDDAAERTVALSTLREETTRRGCTRGGAWQTILDEFWFPGTAGPYRVMAVDLPLRH